MFFDVIVTVSCYNLTFIWDSGAQVAESERRAPCMAEQTVKDLKKELYLLMHKMQEMLDLAEDGFTKNKLSTLAEADELAKEIHAKEDSLIAALAERAAIDNEARSLLAIPSLIANTTSSINRIVEGCRTRAKDGLLFSDKAVSEAKKLFGTSKNALKHAGEATVTGAKASIDTALLESAALMRMSNEFATAHEERLVAGICKVSCSSTYLRMLYAFEDIGAHMKDAVKRLSTK
jgi:Na+/phosphate symporter